jgi:DNA-3-methyladenine glycosylase
MRRRRGLEAERLLCAGPGRLCQALGITGDDNGRALEPPVFELRSAMSPPEIVVGPRIGLSVAMELPWRYGLEASRYLSKPFPAA